MPDASAQPHPTAPPRWIEPTSRLPLRWGSYRGRYLAAIALVFGGALILQATSVYANYFLPVGVAAGAAGWAILPASGLRRIAVVAPASFFVASPLVGSGWAMLLVVPLIAWLFVRQRPMLSWLVALLPLASGFVLAQLFPQYGNGLTVVLVSLAVLVGCSWLARAVAASRPAQPRPIPSNPGAPTR
ncbi:MAG: hypothetical protein JWO10_1984 [Microbacteriaceae bacterium]|nr:hypothetical protein [Microbacteriaceae bacterium]